MKETRAVSLPEGMRSTPGDPSRGRLVIGIRVVVMGDECCSSFWICSWGGEITGGGGMRLPSLQPTSPPNPTTTPPPPPKPWFFVLCFCCWVLVGWVGGTPHNPPPNPHPTPPPPPHPRPPTTYPRPPPPTPAPSKPPPPPPSNHPNPPHQNPPGHFLFVGGFLKLFFFLFLFCLVFFVGGFLGCLLFCFLLFVFVGLVVCEFFGFDRPPHKTPDPPPPHPPPPLPPPTPSPAPPRKTANKKPSPPQNPPASQRSSMEHRGLNSSDPTVSQRSQNTSPRTDRHRKLEAMSGSFRGKKSKRLGNKESYLFGWIEKKTGIEGGGRAKAVRSAENGWLGLGEVELEAHHRETNGGAETAHEVQKLRKKKKKKPRGQGGGERCRGSHGGTHGSDVERESCGGTEGSLLMLRRKNTVSAAVSAWEHHPKEKKLDFPLKRKTVKR